MPPAASRTPSPVKKSALAGVAPGKSRRRRPASRPTARYGMPRDCNSEARECPIAPAAPKSAAVPVVELAIALLRLGLYLNVCTELRARRDVKLLVRGAQVLLHGFVRDRQKPCDLEVRASARGEGRDLALACGQQSGRLSRIGARSSSIRRGTALEAFHIVRSAATSKDRKRRVRFAGQFERLRFKQREP